MTPPHLQLRAVRGKVRAKGVARAKGVTRAKAVARAKAMAMAGMAKEGAASLKRGGVTPTVRSGGRLHEKDMVCCGMSMKIDALI